MCSTKSSKSNIRLKSLNTLGKVFKSFLAKKWLSLLNASEIELYENSSKKLNADEEYRLWMNKRYMEYKNILLEFVGKTTNTEVKRNKHSHVIKVRHFI
jgi:outer membrane lipoprotein-sorting protein